MTNWMLRGLVFGAAMVVVRLFQGTLISVWQTQAALISVVLLVLFLVGVVAWGVLDGRADAAANPDPDRRSDLAMTWLLAGLVAGLLSGAVTWLIAVFYKSLYVGGLTAYSEEPEETTEAVSTADSEEKTKKIAWPSPAREEKTEAIPAHETGEPTEHIETKGDPERTEPTAKRDDA
jgi:hypothetical protein